MEEMGSACSFLRVTAVELYQKVNIKNQNDISKSKKCRNLPTLRRDLPFLHFALSFYVFHFNF
jgi:hypothetical protein